MSDTAPKTRVTLARWDALQSKLPNPVEKQSFTEYGEADVGYKKAGSSLSGRMTGSNPTWVIDPFLGTSAMALTTAVS